jgi:hypothetical protein
MLTQLRHGHQPNLISTTVNVKPKRLHTYRSCVWLAAQHAIAFRLPPLHSFSPLPIQHLLVALQAAPLPVRYLESKLIEGRLYAMFSEEAGKTNAQNAGRFQVKLIE